jgi:hypothetical protein
MKTLYLRSRVKMAVCRRGASPKRRPKNHPCGQPSAATQIAVAIMAAARIMAMAAGDPMFEKPYVYKRSAFVDPPQSAPQEQSSSQHLTTNKRPAREAPRLQRSMQTEAQMMMMSAAGSCTTIDELSSATIEDTAQSAARQQSLPHSVVPLHLTTYKRPADNSRLPAASYRSQTSQASHRTVRTGALAGISVVTELASSPAADEARAAAAAEGLELLPSSSNDTGFKGVFNKGAKYATQIWENGKMRLLGTFATPEEAALCYARHIGKKATDPALPAAATIVTAVEAQLVLSNDMGTEAAAAVQPAEPAASAPKPAAAAATAVPACLPASSTASPATATAEAVVAAAGGAWGMFGFGGWLTQTQELTEPSSSTAAPAPDEPKVTSNVDKRPKNLATNLVMRQVKRLAKDDATAAVPISATDAPPATDNSESTSLFGWFGKFSLAEEHLPPPPPPPPPPRDGKLSHKALPPKAFYQVEPPKMKPQIEEEQPLSRPSTAPVESKVLVQQDEIVFKSPARGALSPSQMRPSLYNGRPMTANAVYGMTKSHSNEGHHSPFPQMLSTMRSSELRSYRAREALLSDRSYAAKSAVRQNDVQDYELRYLLCKQAHASPHSRHAPPVRANALSSPGKERFYTPSSPWIAGASPSPTRSARSPSVITPSVNGGSSRQLPTPESAAKPSYVQNEDSYREPSRRVPARTTIVVKQHQEDEEGPTADEVIGIQYDGGQNTGTTGTLRTTDSSLSRPPYRESEPSYMQPKASSRGEFRDNLSKWSARTGLPRQATHRCDMAMPILTETQELWMDVLETTAGPSPYAGLSPFGNFSARHTIVPPGTPVSAPQQPYMDEEARIDEYRRGQGLPPRQIFQQTEPERIKMMNEQQRRCELERLSKLQKLRANWQHDKVKLSKAERKKANERLTKPTSGGYSRPNSEPRVYYK